MCPTELSKNCAECGLEQKTFCSLLTSPPPEIERNQLIQTGLWLEKSYECHGLQYTWHGCAPSLPTFPTMSESGERKKNKKKVSPGAKLQSQLCCPHRDLGITFGLPYFKHPAVEEHINQK